jgi:hypothetical protein
MSNMNPPADLRAWAAHAAELYPQIDTIALVGSRAVGWYCPDSDFDIAIYIPGSAYAPEREAETLRLEQCIAFDPEVRFEGLDLFFLRPCEGLGRWEWPPGEPPDWVTREPCEDFRGPLRAGDVDGDFDQFFRDLIHAVVLFKRRQRSLPGRTKPLRENPALRALFTAIRQGDRSAVLPLADLLEELDALDLAAPIRKADSRGGRVLVQWVARAFYDCHGDMERRLLRWEDDPHERQTLTLHRAIQAVSLGDVPVLTKSPLQDDRRVWAGQARSLFHRLELRGIQVEAPDEGSNNLIGVRVPQRGKDFLNNPVLIRKLWDKQEREGKRVLAKLRAILARGFPGLAKRRVWVPGLGRVGYSAGDIHRLFHIGWTDSDLWRVPDRWTD